jgi:transglutaminase-like putative cysteine protease
MIYEVTHTTRYVYESPVSYCINEARLTPRRMPGQLIRETEIRVDPPPFVFNQRTDYFGNDVASFGVFESHDRFVAKARSVVDVQVEDVNLDREIPWEEVRNLLRPGAGYLSAMEFVFDSPFVMASQQLAEYAQESFVSGRPMAEAVTDLGHRIHEDFEYQPASTSIDMPLEEIFENRRGVCQDFAHLMIGCLRSIGLAARYVSGYVRPRPAFRGAQASHAWVGVFLPPDVWLPIDPTNNVIPTDSHITLAWGRDYGDVTPMKGVTLGGGEQHVSVEVYLTQVRTTSDQEDDVPPAAGT